MQCSPERHKGKTYGENAPKWRTTCLVSTLRCHILILRWNSRVKLSRGPSRIEVEGANAPFRVVIVIYCDVCWVVCCVVLCVLTGWLTNFSGVCYSSRTLVVINDFRCLGEKMFPNHRLSRVIYKLAFVSRNYLRLFVPWKCIRSVRFF